MEDVQLKARLQVKIIEWLNENKADLSFDFINGDPDLTALYMMKASWQVCEVRRALTIRDPVFLACPKCHPEKHTPLEAEPQAPGEYPKFVYCPIHGKIKYPFED